MPLILEYNSEMKNVALCLLTMALMLSSGCSILFPDNRPHVKEVADKLDAIPIGTPADQIPVNGNLAHVIPGVLVWGCLTENPIEDSDITLYRQVPDGILLQVTTNDFWLEVPVIEDGSMYIDDTPSGTLEIFFDSDKKYKGYFAYKEYGGSYKDSKERLELGKKQYIDSGTIQWSEYIRKADNYSHSFFQEHYPKMPLSQNTGQLSAPFPDHLVHFDNLHLSDEEGQMLYSKAMTLLASSTFNSDPFNWRSDSKYADELRAMNSKDRDSLRISFLPNGKEKTIQTLGGDINTEWIGVSLNYDNANIVIFTSEKWDKTIAHDKFDPKLCDEFWKAIIEVSAGKR